MLSASSINDNTLVRDALHAFYTEHNLGEDGGINKNWATFKVGRFYIPFPNTSSRKKALLWHDIHHLTTGYNGYWEGEISICAWEVASNCRGYYAAWFLDLGGMALGAWLYPRKMFNAFIRGRRTHNLYSGILTADEAKTMTLGEVRHLLKLNKHTSEPATGNEIAAFLGWTSLSWLMFGWPFLVLAICLYQKLGL
ncbi:MAG: hypothetical protein U0V74_09465 [Chitinophagales bacterium]